MKMLFVGALAAAAVWPVTLDPPEGSKRFLEAHAVGVQIYACNGSAWTFVAPRADLYGANGKRVATHFAGPTWQATDGSRVVGRVVARESVGSTAIPWLLLEAASTAEGADGTRLAHTSHIQRVNTTGGLAPAAATCTAGAAGTTAEVPYTADYRFFKASGD